MAGPTGKNFSYDKDTGYAELATRFKGKGGSVFVGFLQSSGVYRTKEERGSQPITVAQVAAIHEFGSSDGRIPQRSFMGATLDAKNAEVFKFMEKLIAGYVDHKYSEIHALGMLGQKVKDMFRAAITKGLKPALRPATLRRKGPNKGTPLIDTGQLLASISFEVRKAGK